MDIAVTISQNDHDIVLSQLRKKEDGSDDLTVSEWVQQALDGKINACLKRADPVKVLERENLALRQERDSLLASLPLVE